MVKNTRYNSAIAEDALVLFEPFIQSLLESGATKRQDLHIIIGTSKGDVLLERAYSSTKEWDLPFAKIARSKFDITCREQKSTREVQSLCPELAGEKGDTFYWGSWIDGGIVVAVSGVQPYWDEAISKMLVAIVRALITGTQEVEVSQGKNFRGEINYLKNKKSLFELTPE